MKMVWDKNKFGRVYSTQMKNVPDLQPYNSTLIEI